MFGQNAEADAVFDKAAAEFDKKNEANSAWGFLKHDRWDADLNAGEIRFTFKDGLIVTAPVQAIGSFDHEEETWQWAWDNPSFNRLLVQHSLLCRTFGERLKLREFTTPKFDCSWEDARWLAATGLHLADGAGLYEAKSPPLTIFLNFGPVDLQRIN